MLARPGATWWECRYPCNGSEAEILDLCWCKSGLGQGTMEPWAFLLPNTPSR